MWPVVLIVKTLTSFSQGRIEDQRDRINMISPGMKLPFYPSYKIKFRLQNEESVIIHNFRCEIETYKSV